METNFNQLGLQQDLLQAIIECGYETPTPIQNNAIPALLGGRDVLGQAQTGTGKTAAFALPMLQVIDTEQSHIQALILTPTRELASQVANNIHLYGKYRQARVLPVIGGTSYDRQLRRLEKGAHIVVGTPGRTLDLINRGAMDFSRVKYVVLDEADEMLKMGFIEDVETILQTIPRDQRQTALFSATLPDEIQKIARNYMRDPQLIKMAKEKLTVEAIEQRYYLVHPDSKLPALSRLLETEEIHSALIFTRTRAGSMELAEALLERGYTADALHGELNQPARESVLRRFRNGQLPVLVATDVVARGVDITGVSHVFNYDMPYDPEDYVHRIGRTGRAGRTGIAIMMVTPRERRYLNALEDYTKQKIVRHELPKLETVRQHRDRRFLSQLTNVIDNDSLEREQAMLEELLTHGYDIEQIATATLRLLRADELNRPIDHVKSVSDEPVKRSSDGRRRGEQGDRGDRGGKREGRGDVKSRRPEIMTGREAGMVRLILNQGHNHGIRPRDIVGAIAGEVGISGKDIGAIDIQNDQTFVDVKASQADRILREMGQWRLRGKPIKLTRADQSMRGK
ncbi:MAG: DEAD/DEAH box helicase [Anaerolineae bacterium]|jgi:ATP-dependent RNA helicase DeaD|nr:DEAD/DEAH box helicase [Anaerolineae bacterium]